jgi:hypothetical protein
MPFILPRAREREYLTANGVVAIYVADLDDDHSTVGTSRDLAQSLYAIRRHHKYAAIMAAFWVKSQVEAQSIVNEVNRNLEKSRATSQALVDRIKLAATRLNFLINDHDSILLRARAAVTFIDERLSVAQQTGQLKYFNRAYQRWRLEAISHGRGMSYAEARARLRASLYRQIAAGEPSELHFPALEVLTAA